MNFRFSGRKISGILTVVPANEVPFEAEIGNYSVSPAKSMKLKLAMGYNKHRIVAGDVCVSDLCVFGLEHLFAKGLLKKDDIDALVLVTQSPDHFMPATSNIIQGRLGLKQDVLCLDICQGCAGYEIGLLESFLLLGQESIGKVVLLNADVLSRKVSRRDRNSFPLIGDGAAITVLERGDAGSEIYANLKMDGARADALIIPAGGFRCPSTPETGEMVEDENGNFRAKDHLVMQGDAVFNFVQVEVPPMIEALLGSAGLTPDAVDLFHVPPAQQVHAPQAGGQDERRARPHAGQHRRELRQCQRRHGPVGDHVQPGRPADAGAAEDLHGRLRRRTHLELDPDGRRPVGILRYDRI